MNTLSGASSPTNRVRSMLMISVLVALLGSLLITSPVEAAMQIERGERTIQEIGEPVFSPSPEPVEGDAEACVDRSVEADPDTSGEVLEEITPRSRVAAPVATDRGVRPSRGDVFEFDVTAFDTGVLGGGVLGEGVLGGPVQSGPVPVVPDAVWFDPDISYRYEYVSVTDSWALVPGTEVASASDFSGGEGTPPSVAPLAGQSADMAVRSHSRVWAEVVLTAVDDHTSGGQWINVEISGACTQVWGEQRELVGDLAAQADVTRPTSAPDRVEDTSALHQGSFQFARSAAGAVIEIVHGEVPTADVLMFREGFVNALGLDIDAAANETSVAETDRAARQTSAYLNDRDANGPVVSRTAAVPELGLERRADFGLDDDGVVRQVSSRDEMALTASSSALWGESEPATDRDVPWAEGEWTEAPADGAASPVDSFVVSVTNIGLLNTQETGPTVIAAALSTIASPAMRNNLSPETAQAQVHMMQFEKAQSRWDAALALLASTPTTDDARDAVRPEVVRLMTQAILADPDVASQAASFAIADGGDGYVGQVAVAALGSSASSSSDAAVALASVIDSGATHDRVRMGAMMNALSVADPGAALVEAVLARSSTPGELGDMATMIVGSLAAASPDTAVKSRVEAELRGRAPVGDEPANVGLENLERAPVRRSRKAVFQTCTENTEACWIATNCDGTPYPMGQACFDALAAECVALVDTQPVGWGYCMTSGLWPELPGGDPGPEYCGDTCWVADNCDGTPYPMGQACFDALTVLCLSMASTDWNDGSAPVGWGYCNQVWPNTDPSIAGTGSTGSCTTCSAFRPPEPGDLMWDTVMGPNWAQGHFWLGIRPGAGANARLASLAVEAGVELRSGGTVRPIIYGEAAYVMDLEDSDSSNNLNLGEMTVGQIDRRLQLRADWLGTTFYSKTMDFPCGVGASGQLFPPVDVAENANWNDDASPLTATEGTLLEDIVWAGPAVNGSVPVLGVVSISLGVGVSARIGGDWGWSLDMCDALISDVLGTASAEVRLHGSVDVQAYAGVEVILVEAGVGIRATIFKVEAPLRASVQLINDAGTLRLRPCYSFSITPTAWAVNAYAYATVFINLIFKKVVLWHREVTLFDFNLGESAGLGGASGSWEVFGSDCDPTPPTPPIIVADDGQPPYQLNGFFRNPLMNGPSGSLPIGTTGSTGWNPPPAGGAPAGEYRTGLQKAIDAFCGVMGLAPTVTPPVVVGFDAASTDASGLYFTETYHEDPETGLGVGDWNTSTSGMRVEEMQCGAAVTNDIGDITITAEINTGFSWNGADANTTELQLEHGESYPVRFMVTNQGTEDLMISSIVIDAQPIGGCDDEALPAGQVATCETTFVALQNPAAGIDPDTSAPTANTPHVVSVHFDDAAAPSEHHAWYHGIDPSTLEMSATAVLRIVTDDCPLCQTLVAPGPDLGTGGNHQTDLAIASDLPIVAIDLPGEFASLSCPLNGSGNVICTGDVSYAPATGYGPYEIVIPLTVKLADGTESQVTATTWWYANFDQPPLLSVSTRVSYSLANTYPGPQLSDEDPYVRVEFEVSNSNPLSEIEDVSATWTIDGSSYTIGNCWKQSTLWTCAEPAASIPQTGQQMTGSVTITADWGNESTELTRPFYVRTGIAQPVFCEANGGEGITCGLPDLAEINVLDEQYLPELTWNGGMAGIWDGAVSSAVVVQIADRTLFEEIWTVVDSTPAGMLLVLNELEEAGAVDLLVVNGYRIAPEQQIEDLMRVMLGAYDVSPSLMGARFADASAGTVYVSDMDASLRAPVAPTLLFDNSSGTRTKLNPVDSVSLFVRLPGASTSAEVQTPAQIDALNYWDLVQWSNLALFRLEQQQAITDVITEQLQMPAGATPFVVADEWVDGFFRFTDSPSSMDPVGKLLQSTAIDRTSITPLLSMDLGYPTAQSQRAIRDACAWVGGCTGTPVVPPTGFSAIGWQNVGGEVIRQVGGVIPPEVTDTSWAIPGFAAEEIAWYQACSWLCDHMFNLGFVDLIDENYSFLEYWRSPTIVGPLPLDRGSMLVQVLPGQSSAVATGVMIAGLETGEMLAALKDLVDDGVVEVLRINERWLVSDEASLTAFMAKTIEEHSLVPDMPTGPVEPGVYQVAPFSDERGVLATVRFLHCLGPAGTGYEFGSLISHADEIAMTYYPMSAPTVWQAVTWSTGAGYYRAATFADFVALMNHELVHVRQGLELDEMVRSHPTALPGAARSGLVSDAAPYNNCADGVGYQETTAFGRAIEAAAIGFEQLVVESTYGLEMSVRMLGGTQGHCADLDCHNVYLSSPFPIYGVTAEPTLDASDPWSYTVLNPEFTEAEILEALDPTD